MVALGTVLAVFQPPSSQSTLSGSLMRSEANLLLSECQPRPRLGSSPARATALFYQSRTSLRISQGVGSPPGGFDDDYH